MIFDVRLDEMTVANLEALHVPAEAFVTCTTVLKMLVLTLDIICVLCGLVAKHTSGP